MCISFSLVLGQVKDKEKEFKHLSFISAYNVQQYAPVPTFLGKN